VVRQVLLIAGGSLLLALVSFVVVVAVNGDPLGLRPRAVASTIPTVPPATLPPTTTAPTPSTLATLVPPGWAVHNDPGTGYQIAVPPAWQVVADGGPTPSCATRAPRRCCASTGSRTPRPTR
jgi:hypothetical protein